MTLVKFLKEKRSLFVMLFLAKLSVTRVFREEKADSCAPDKLLLARFTYLSIWRSPIEAGMVPLRPLLGKLIDWITVAFCTQRTPYQVHMDAVVPFQFVDLTQFGPPHCYSLLFTIELTVGGLIEVHEDRTSISLYILNINNSKEVQYRECRSHRWWLL